MTAPRLYLRRCNNQPAAGIPITRGTVEAILALSQAAGAEVRGDLETELAIHIPAGRPWAVDAAGSVARTFTYTPMPEPT